MYPVRRWQMLAVAQVSLCFLFHGLRPQSSALHMEVGLATSVNLFWELPHWLGSLVIAILSGWQYQPSLNWLKAFHRLLTSQESLHHWWELRAPSSWPSLPPCAGPGLAHSLPFHDELLLLHRWPWLSRWYTFPRYNGLFNKNYPFAQNKFCISSHGNESFSPHYNVLYIQSLKAWRHDGRHKLLSIKCDSPFVLWLSVAFQFHLSDFQELLCYLSCLSFQVTRNKSNSLF